MPVLWLARKGRRPLACCAALCAAVLAGCRDDSGVGKTVPVVGVVSVDNKPVPAGSVSFRPDKAKGNESRHEPAGDIDAQGRYKLYTAGKEGAPPGWYKVAVISAEPDAYPPKKLYAPPKYGDIATSGLSVEVVEGAPPGAYDLKLSK